MAEPIDVAGFSFSVVTLGDTFVQVDFASAWQNLAQPSDVNNDGNVTAGDALRIINELARRAFSDPVTAELDDPSSVSPWPNIYFDQNGDGLATALDALRVINQLARQQNGGGSGEGESAQAVSGPITRNVIAQRGRGQADNQHDGSRSGDDRKPSVADFAAIAEHFDFQRMARSPSLESRHASQITESVDQLLSDRSFIEELSREVRSDLLDVATFARTWSARFAGTSNSTTFRRRLATYQGSRLFTRRPLFRPVPLTLPGKA